MKVYSSLLTGSISLGAIAGSTVTAVVQWNVLATYFDMISFADDSKR